MSKKRFKVTENSMFVFYNPLNLHPCERSFDVKSRQFFSVFLM